MLRTLGLGGAPDAAFRLELTFEPAGHGDAAGRPPPIAAAASSLSLLNFEWTSAEDSATVVERFARALAERGATAATEPEPQLAVAGVAADNGGGSSSGALPGAIVSAADWQDEPTPPGAAPPPPQQQQPQQQPAPLRLRGAAFHRTSGAGAAPELLVTALLALLDTPSVQRLRLCDGLGWAVAAWAVDAPRWQGLRALNLSGCGLASLPPAVAALSGGLEELRLGGNRLAALPPEVGALTALRVLAAEGNQLAAAPAELGRLTALVELDLSSNRLARLSVDTRALARLTSLQLAGNPLDLVPELAPLTALRALSLANVRKGGGHGCI